jgi:oxygen-dependent protoporphyrinogen oxidase
MTDSDPDSSSFFRVAVIGGGLSGLATAHRIGEISQRQNRPCELTLFEAGPQLGGVMGTQRVGDYLVETGADMFITNQPWAVDLCKRLGLEDRLIPTDETYRGSQVLHHSKPVPVPEGFMLLAPAQIWPVLTSSIFSLRGKLRMGLEYVIPRRQCGGDESLASFVKRRFGKEALGRLIQPLVGGIYTADPEQLSLQATLPRFLEMEQTYRSLIRASRKQVTQHSESETSGSGARYGLFVTLKEGISELLDALGRKVEQMGTVRLDTPVMKLSRREKPDNGWDVTLKDGSTESFDAVVLALRSHQAADLLKGAENELAGFLRKIPYASTAVVISGHQLADIQNPLSAFGLVIPMIENRKILAVSYASRKFPGRAPQGHVILRTFVGGAMQPELFDLSDDEIYKLVREELHDILGITGEPDFQMIARYEKAMPQYHVGHLQRVEHIEQRVSRLPGLALAGNAYRGVGIPDCIHSGEQAAERVCAMD